jgi:hypothetical protein
MAGTRFSVVLLLTPHSADAAQHTGLFAEPNILAGAASVARHCMTARGAKRAFAKTAKSVRLPEGGRAELLALLTEKLHQ